MNAIEKRVWAYSVQFLKVFKPLQYDGVQLNTILFRDFQRFCKKHYHRLPKMKVKNIPAHRLHQASEPYFHYARPELDVEKKGYTLVRADLYAAVRKVQQEKFIYLAHTRQEYNKMRKIKACRPLYLLQNLKPVPHVRERKKVMRQLAAIYRSSKTPKLFRTTLFRRWMKKKLSSAMVRVSRVHRLFKMKPIKQILYGSTLNHHGSTVSNFAQSRGIPVINLQHGIFGEFGHIPANADWNIVWSKAHAEFLMRHGVPRHKIKVSAPYFVRSLHPFKGERLKPSDKLKILVATQPINSTRKLFQTIETATKPMQKQVSVYYKLHPDQRNVRLYRKWVQNESSKLIPHGTANLQHLLHHSDLVITPFSTVGYEALLQNKHVFFYGHSRRLYYLKNRPICFRNANSLTKLIQWVRLPKIKNKLTIHMKLKDNTTAARSNQSIWEAVKKFREEALAAREQATANIDSDHPGEDGVQGATEEK